MNSSFRALTMGCYMSARGDSPTQEEIDAMQEGPARSTAQRVLDLRKAEETAKRLYALYDIELSPQHIVRDRYAERTTICVRVDGQDVQTEIVPEEPCVLLKALLHEESPPGANVAPPTVSRLTMGGHELHNGDSYGEHDVQQDATLALTFDVARRVSIQGTTAEVWADEKIRNVLKRLGLDNGPWLLGDGEHLDVSQTVAQAGLVDGCRMWMHELSDGCKVKTWVGLRTAEDYELAFRLKIHGSEEELGSIVHFTNCNDDDISTSGSLVPGIFIAARSTALLVVCGRRSGRRFFQHQYTSHTALAKETEYDVVIKCQGGRLDVQLDGAEYFSGSLSGSYPSVEVEVHIGGSLAATGGAYHSSANASISGMQYHNLATGTRYRISSAAWRHISDFAGTEFHMLGRPLASNKCL